MSLLTQPIHICHIGINNNRPLIQCNCCRRVEQAKQPLTKEMWLQAANYIGWRHVTSEAFDIDVVCPACVNDFNNPVRKPRKPIKRVSA
ncbi:hypothetical protein ACSLBF_10395 [Pseudoalteromonas sp. T1lg65]|uniref:hypothetical protein n=1 Tax=Pseudoalteromonas sp. T1lg65 TaxID=2077101 RepID=UPI003F7A95BD